VAAGTVKELLVRVKDAEVIAAEYARQIYSMSQQSTRIVTLTSSIQGGSKRGKLCLTAHSFKTIRMIYMIFGTL